MLELPISDELLQIILTGLVFPVLILWWRQRNETQQVHARNGELLSDFVDLLSDIKPKIDKLYDDHMDAERRVERRKEYREAFEAMTKLQRAEHERKQSEGGT